MRTFSVTAMRRRRLCDSPACDMPICLSILALMSPHSGLVASTTVLLVKGSVLRWLADKTAATPYCCQLDGGACGSSGRVCKPPVRVPLLRTTKHLGLGDDVPKLQVPAALVAPLDDARERDAADLPVGEAVFVLAPNVLHRLGVEQDPLVGEDLGHVDFEDGLLYREQPGEVDGAADEGLEPLVSGLG